MASSSLCSILHVIRPSAGGMRRHLCLLCNGLAARGFASTIAAPVGFPLPDEESVLGSNGGLFFVPLAARPHPLHDLRAALSVSRRVRRVDILHAHGLRGAWVGGLAARLAHRPFLFTAHNLAPSEAAWWVRTLFGRVVSHAAAVIAVSHAVADSLIPYGVDCAKITVIPNGLDLTPFDASAQEPPAPPQVVAVGRLAPEKGFDVLVEAAPLVLARRSDTRFVLAGEGPERDRLAERVAALGMASEFSLIGYSADVPGLLASSTIVTVPSRREGQGLVALEAMAARRPVIASRVGGLVETVEEGKTGLLVRPEDPVELAEGLIRMLEDRAAGLRMGDAGRARVERDYTVDRMVDSTVSLYEKVVA